MDPAPVDRKDALPSPMLVTAFGHGRHSCPAQPFSLAAMTAATTRLLGEYRMTPAGRRIRSRSRPRSAGWPGPTVPVWSATADRLTRAAASAREAVNAVGRGAQATAAEIDGDQLRRHQRAVAGVGGPEDRCRRKAHTITTSAETSLAVIPRCAHEEGRCRWMRTASSQRGPAGPDETRPARSATVNQLPTAIKLEPRAQPKLDPSPSARSLRPQRAGQLLPDHTSPP